MDCKVSKRPTQFEGFILCNLAHYLDFPIKEFHRELISLIDEDRLAIAAPRYFAKSTYFSLFYPLFLALHEGPVSILLVSATGALAETWLGKIRKELEINNRLINNYGLQENKDNKWTDEEIHLSNGSIIVAKGSEKQIRGFHPNVIVCDDLETDEMVLSSERRKKFDDWFWKTVVGTQAKQIIVVGTILHPESFLAELINKGRYRWVTKFYAARYKTEGGWKSLWPHKFPIDKLSAMEKEMGTYEFESELMNNPIPDDLRKFQKKWIKYFEKEPPGCVYFTTVDPAIEIDKVNDFTAIVTCAVDRDENIYVVEALNKKILPKETIDLIFDVWKRWGSATIGIEAVGFQKMLQYDIEAERKKRREYPTVVPLKSDGVRKGLRIEALQPRFENGKIYIKESMKDLETQLLRFPSPRSHDDLIDALAYVLKIIRPAQHEIQQINPDCFLANLERRRELTGFDGVWGNHALRGIS